VTGCLLIYVSLNYLLWPVFEPEVTNVVTLVALPRLCPGFDVNAFSERRKYCVGNFCKRF
jgi:hypothetical protein